MIDRRLVAGLSATGLVMIALNEGYRDKAYIPVPGDVPSIGFGTTANVKLGDTITPPEALKKELADIKQFENAVNGCVTAPLTQNEFDAYVSLTYNIGAKNFCSSTLVRLLNERKYPEACAEILKWDKFKGKSLPGLTKRRTKEYQKCLTS